MQEFPRDLIFCLWKLTANFLTLRIKTLVGIHGICCLIFNPVVCLFTAILSKIRKEAHLTLYKPRFHQCAACLLSKTLYWTRKKMAVLSQGVGYGVVIGIGALFAGMADFTLSYPPFSPHISGQPWFWHIAIPPVCMSLITKALHRYLNENQQSSEMYMTAQRTVKMGLTASAIVSAWTWVRSFDIFKVLLNQFPTLCDPIKANPSLPYCRPLHCCKVHLWRTNMVSLVPSGMLLVLQFRSCYSQYWLSSWRSVLLMHIPSWKSSMLVTAKLLTLSIYALP